MEQVFKMKRYGFVSYAAEATAGRETSRPSSGVGQGMSGMSKLLGFLYARPSFVEGVARLLDFGGVLNEYNQSRTGREADWKALRADWITVGDDLWDAAEQVAEGATPRRRLPTRADGHGGRLVHAG